MSLLEIDDLTVRFGTGRDSVVPVSHVNLDIESGTVVGLVGESGSGKSTLARSIVGLAPVKGGRILLDGVDLTRSDRKSRQARRLIQLVFQDPYSSLNPRMSIGDSIGEGLTAAGERTRAGRIAGTRKFLELVNIDPRHAESLPRVLSGGQRQRVALARALASRPQVLLADEITSALDASVQGAILNLIRTIQDATGVSILFISHNLAAVRYVSSRIAVMYCGSLVETAGTEELIRGPQHPYTSALLDAVPRLRHDAATANSLPLLLSGDPADPYNPPTGCRFHPRCQIRPHSEPGHTLCSTDDPSAEAANRPHDVACFFPQGPRKEPL